MRFSVIIVLFFIGLSCSKENLPEVPFNTTLPVNEEADSITFAVIGDYGKAGDAALAVSTLVKTWDPDFIITVGDNNYQKGELSTIEENISQYYHDFIHNQDAPREYQCLGKAAANQQNRFFPSLGNHDQANRNGYKPYQIFFSLPGEEVYYDFQWGPVHFFTINSGKKTDHSCCDSEQATWLKEKLAQSTKPFKLVYFHHPPYSSSKHGNETDMQWPFEAWGATAVLSGHDHTYERITKRENPTFPYFVNGLGGKSLYDCGKSPLNEDLFDRLCYDQDFGAMRCKATKDKLVFQFVTVKNPTESMDEFVIWK